MEAGLWAVRGRPDVAAISQGSGNVFGQPDLKIDAAQ